MLSAPACPHRRNGGYRSLRRMGDDMPTDYLVYSAVSINVTTPIVLCASLNPPDAPTSGLAQTEFRSGSWEQAWTLLPVFNSNWSVLQHKISGFALRFGARDAQLTLTPYVPFDPSFYLSFSGTDQNVQIFNVGQPNLMVTVMGSAYTPPTAVNGSADNQAQGQRWLLVPFATAN
jgi:hypothetical protein